MICDRLGRQFTREELNDAVEAVAGGSDPTVEEYTERVLNRRGAVPHPENLDRFVPEEDARDHGVDPDAPAVDREPYGALSRTERVRGVRIELARRATSNGGKRRVDATTIQRDFFDGGEPSDGHVRTPMRDAADADGFKTAERDGKEWLYVDLSDVTDPELFDAVSAGRTADAGSAASTRDPEGSAEGARDVEGGADRGGSEGSDRAERDGFDTDDRDVAAGVDARMDELTSATFATDGGRDGEES